MAPHVQQQPPEGCGLAAESLASSIEFHDVEASAWLASLSDRIDYQTTLQDLCLARLGDPGNANHAQRSDRQLRLLEYCANRIAEGVASGSSGVPASVWKPKLVGAGVELRNSPNRQHPKTARSNSLEGGVEAKTSLQRQQVYRGRSESKNSFVDDTFSDPADEPPTPALASAARRAHAVCRMVSAPVGGDDPPRRNSKWRAVISDIAAEASLPRAGSLQPTLPGLPQVDENCDVDWDAFTSGAPESGAEPQRAPRDHLDGSLWSFRRRMWQFFEDKQSSRGALIYGHASMLLILTCMCVSMVDVLFPSEALPAVFVLGMEFPFVLELAGRFWVCPNRDVFWFDLYNLIDLLAVLVNLVPRVVVNLSHMDPDIAYACRIFSPLLFLLRFLRRFEHFQLLASAFAAAARALPVLLYTCFLIALFHAGAIYLAEPRDVFPSMRDSLWFTIITMSTVGYGDIAPVSDLGRALTTNLIVLAGLYTAIPIGIVGNAFSKVWEDRDRLLLMQHLRQRISRGGYTPRDLAEMFRRLDEDGNGQLSFEEFKALLPMMHIGMSDTVAFRVFETFDDDGAGSIDFEEFLLGVFPAQGFFVAAHRRSAASEFGA